MCSGGVALEVRTVVADKFCAGFQSNNITQCTFGCSNITVFISASESLYTIKQQLESGGFLNQIFGMN